MSKIERIRGANYKKLKLIDYSPQSLFIRVLGKNGSGKTSTLDLVFAGLAGTEGAPTQPVRKGEKTAFVELDLGDIKVTRFWPSAEDPKSRLSVVGKNGAEYQKPQDYLDRLAGKRVGEKGFNALAFDPLHFTRRKPKEQYDELLRIARVDVDPQELDNANKADYDARRAAKTEAKKLQAQAEAISFVAELPAEPIDISALLVQMQEAGSHNLEVERAKTAQAEHERAANRYRTAEQEARTEAERQLKIAEQMKKNAEAETAQAEVSIPQAIDTSLVLEQIENARATNSQIEQRTRKAKLIEEAAAQEAAADAFDAAMTERNKTKQAAIDRSELPIAGLGFVNEEVTYNGIPLAQASSAEQLRIGMAIAMAGDPQLRIVLIRDGSLLDEDSERLIEEMAIERDFQVWIECVGNSGKAGIVLEEGEIIAVNLPAPAAKAAKPAKARKVKATEATE